MDLTEFLEARISEDEAIARAAINPVRPGIQWVWKHVGEEEGPVWLRTVEEFPTTSGVGDLPAFPLGYEAVIDRAPAMPHVARWDPARVLAECAAKRAIIALHEAAGVDCRTCGTAGEHGVDYPCETLRALALPDADHPDYREEWRP